MNIYTFKTKNFTITVDSEPGYDIDLSFDETGEVREKIKSGEWEHFQVEVKILFRGEEIASDYLGGCIYANPREFRDHIGIRKHGANVGSYFSDMVRQSVKDARKHFENAPKLRAV